MKYVGIDFEFSDVTEPILSLVCVSVKPEGEDVFSYDLTNSNQIEQFKKRIKQYQEGYILLAFSADAEQRSFTSLGLDWFKWKWIDIRTEYKMLQNKSNKFAYGKQLIRGRVKYTKPKYKWQEDTVTNEKAETSLAACSYKMLGVSVDTAEKNAVRDMIIKKTWQPSDMKRIIAYCESDVQYLIKLYKEIKKELDAALKVARDTNWLQRAAINRGIYSGLVSDMVSWGYPVSMSEALSLTGSIPSLMQQVKEDINSKTKEQLGFNIFDAKGKKNVKQLCKFILKKKEEGIQPYAGWLLSKKTGKPSLKEEELVRISGARHNYTNNFIDQLVRYQAVYRTLNGFNPPSAGSSKKSFWDSVGSDGRSRPYFNQFGSQSSRSQPSSTSFIPLKSAWTRYLIQPAEGNVMISIDYGSEEYLIAALISKDQAMTEAYMSGDVYLRFGKDAGLVPQSATKKTHGLIREKLKQTVLMVLYGATEKGLATKLLNLEPDRDYEDLVVEAAELIELFEDTYPAYIQTKEKVLERYESKGFLMLKDGWTMFGDNTNSKSIQNCPFQGAGAVVMREAHKIARLDKGLKVLYTLHDALTIECKKSEWKEKLKDLCESMDLGFTRVCGTANKTAWIKQEASVWGYGLNRAKEDIKYVTSAGRTVVCPTDITDRYIDGRGVEEFEAYSKYFYNPPHLWF